MHSTAVFASTDFEIVDRGQATTHARYFSGFARTDRLGLFAPEGCEGAGATLLIMACVTAFYDRYREEGGDFFAYPDFFSFQRRQPAAAYSMFDIWPGHKDVPVPEGANETAAAITDRGVGIMLLPDRPPRSNEFQRVQMASLERNVRRCLLYSEDGEVEKPTLEVATSKAEPIRDWAAAMFDSVEGDGDWQRRRERFLDRHAAGRGSPELQGDPARAGSSAVVAGGSSCLRKHRRNRHRISRSRRNAGWPGVRPARGKAGGVGRTTGQRVRPLLHLQGGLDPAPGYRLDRAVLRCVGGQQEPIEKDIRLKPVYGYVRVLSVRHGFWYPVQLPSSSRSQSITLIPKPITFPASRSLTSLSSALSHPPPHRSNGVTYSSITLMVGVSPATPPPPSP